MAAVATRLRQACGDAGGIDTLLDLVEEHPAACRYDLLRHGYRLEWVGTRKLPYVDALALLYQQPPHLSAVWRALHPDDFDRTREVQLLEVLAVLVQRGNILGAMNDVPESKMPKRFEDMFEKPAKRSEVSEAELLAGMAAIDERLGVTGG